MLYYQLISKKTEYVSHSKVAFSKTRPHIQNPYDTFADMIVFLTSLALHDFSRPSEMYLWGTATLENAMFHAFT